LRYFGAPSSTVGARVDITVMRANRDRANLPVVGK
jgi:hypothetical protein